MYIRIRFLLLVLLLVVSCSTGKEHASRPSTSISEQLVGRVELYRSLSPAVPGTWAYPESCDGLLFSALTAVAQGESIDIDTAQGEPGQWFRNPGKECYPDSSASDISRDMILGLMIYAVHFDRLDILEGLWTYGQKNNWVMGRGDDRVVLTPSMIGRLARAIAHQGGETHAEALIPDIPSREASYQGHLSLLGIFLDGKMAGSIGPFQLDALRELAEKMPGNPLAQAMLHKYTDGDQSVATELLLSTWPDNRLATRSDWCEEWRTQRADNDTGLQPCTGKEPEVHTGGDFLFVAALIRGEI